MTDLSAPSVPTSTPVASEHSYVDWAAILAGAVLACAISFVLFTFSAAIGLSISSPHEGEGVSVAAFAFATGLWIVWVQVLSFAAGGYLTGRMRRRAYDSTEHEVDVRDGIHGLLVWASGALLGAFLATSSLAGGPAVTEGSMSSVASTVVESVANAAVGEDETVGDAVGAELTASEEVRADAVRRWAIIAAFVAAASLLVGAAAAFFTAGLGGRHRDQGLVLPFFQRQQWK